MNLRSPSGGSFSSRCHSVHRKYSHDFLTLLPFCIRKKFDPGLKENPTPKKLLVSHSFERPNERAERMPAESTKHVLGCSVVQRSGERGDVEDLSSEGKVRKQARKILDQSVSLKEV